MPVLRTVKNIVKNHTDAEVKVREATSNDPWGPSSTLMAEIADLTYNVVAFTEIMQMVWKRLNDHGKNWRHVYKSLTLLEYIIKTGSEKVAQQCKENIFAIQTLKDFQHIEDNKDLGANVREKAKGLVALLKDDERLKNERSKALKAKERFAENFGIGSDQSQTQLGRPRQHRAQHGEQQTDSARQLAHPTSDLEEARPHSAGEEELQLQLALAMSKEEADTDAKKKTNDELKLQMALEESKKEDSPPGPQKPESSLLEFASPTVAGNDPWSSQPAPAANDPWAIASPPQAAGPFSPPSADSSADDWLTKGPSTAAAGNSSSYNPWESTPSAGPAVTSDPWMPSSSASPWDAPSSNGNSHKPMASAVDDDFAALGMRSASSQPPSATGLMSNEPLMSMAGLGNDLPNNQAANTKKADNFLDPKANTLVNLDSLVTKPKNSAGVVNPFAMTSQGAGSSTATAMNPFLAQQPPQPSLNQMSNSPSLPAFTSTAPPAMNPMMMGGPAPMAGQMGYPPYQPQTVYPQQPAAQSAFNTNNPFL